MPLGYLCLVLHAHLPFVRHPEYDDFLEEDWLYEAITETYIPLLEVFDGLERDGVDWRLTMSVTPTLAAMLADPLLQYRYVRHLDNLIALAGKEIERTRWQPEFNHLAHMYHDRFLRCPRRLRQAVRQQPAQRLPPLLRHRQARAHHLRRHARLLAADGRSTRNAVRAQIEIGCREFERHFGRRPQGIWLPECGYAPGVDELLRDCRHPLLLHRHARRPVRRAAAASTASTRRSSAPRAASPCLARDTESSKQVWSAIEGYPGDYNYREFYRDVGFDLDYEYLKPHLHQTGIRSNLGIKYYKITGRDRPQGAVQPAGRPGQGGRARRQLHVQPREAGRMARRLDGPAAADRRARTTPSCSATGGSRGRTGSTSCFRKMHCDQQTVKTITVPGVPRPAPEDPGRAAVVVELGLQGLLRSLAGRLQRLDLPPPARGRRPHGRAGAQHTRRRQRAAGAGP